MKKRILVDYFDGFTRLRYQVKLFFWITTRNHFTNDDPTIKLNEWNRHG